MLRWIQSEPVCSMDPASSNSPSITSLRASVPRHGPKAQPKINNHTIILHIFQSHFIYLL